MNKNITNDIIKINQFSKEEQRYLYGECDKWCLENFKKGLEIVAIVNGKEPYHRNGIEHAFLRNSDTGICFDVRGDFESEEFICQYLSVDYWSPDIEEYVFHNTKDFNRFLKWIEFETERDRYLEKGK